MHAVRLISPARHAVSLPLLPSRLPVARFSHSIYKHASAAEPASKHSTKATYRSAARQAATERIAGGGKERWEEDIEEIARQLARRDVAGSKPPAPEDWIAALQSSSKRQTEAMRIKCTVFDTRGKAVQGTTQVFGRSSFCALHGLQSRDLRKIDISVDNSVPTILVRRGGILVNIYHLRCLIKHDSLILFETASYFHAAAISSFVKSLSDTLTDGSPELRGLPFEFKVLELILSNVVRQLEDEWREVRASVVGVISKLEVSIDPLYLRQLLEHSREMDAVGKRVVAVRKLIDELLESDDELTGMYLTERASGRVLQDDEHQEVEQLLESYGVQVEETENAIQSLTSNVQQTQAVVELILDSSRNALLALDLKVSIVTASLTGGALVAAFFGMNLATGLEESVNAFAAAAGTSICLAAVTALFMLRRLRNLRRVGLGTGSFGNLPARLRPPRPGDEVFVRPTPTREKRPWRLTKLM